MCVFVFGGFISTFVGRERENRRNRENWMMNKPILFLKIDCFGKAAALKCITYIYDKTITGKIGLIN